MSGWYYAENKEKIGPLQGSELKDAYFADRINGETLIWREGVKEWLPFNKLKGYDKLYTLKQSYSPPPLPKPAQKKSTESAKPSTTTREKFERCPSCGINISRSVKVCPKCGYRKSLHDRTATAANLALLGVGTVLSLSLFVAVIFLSGMGGGSKDTMLITIGIITVMLYIVIRTRQGLKNKKS